MPQALAKCRRPSHVLTSAPAAHDRLKDKARIWCNRKRFKWQRKTEKTNLVPLQKEPTGVPPEEDWEVEIEEFSCRMKEKETSSETPYDPEVELKVALCEMSLYSVPHTPRPHQQHYNPSTHHTPPVKWIRHVSCFEVDQFANAED